MYVDSTKTITEIRTAIKKKFGRKFITASELCQISDIPYPVLMRDRPEEIFKHFAKVGSSWICSSSDAAKIVKNWEEGK